MNESHQTRSVVEKHKCKLTLRTNCRVSIALRAGPHREKAKVKAKIFQEKNDKHQRKFSLLLKFSFGVNGPLVYTELFTITLTLVMQKGG